MALFQDVGSSACLLTASKMADVIAGAPGNDGEQSDAPQAYTQSEIEGVDTRVELPPDQWPPSWFFPASGGRPPRPKYRRPVCPLRLALYGHPKSGACWERFCNKRVKKRGFYSVPGWEQCFYHPELRLFLIIYVDDFKLVGPKENIKKGWALLSQDIRLDEPTKLQRYLGCDHEMGNIGEKEARPHLDRFKGIVDHCNSLKSGKRGATPALNKPLSGKQGATPATQLKTMTYSMSGFAMQCVDRYLELSGSKVEDLKPASTPTLDDQSFAIEDYETRGALATVCAKIVPVTFGTICYMQSTTYHDF